MFRERNAGVQRGDASQAGYSLSAEAGEVEVDGDGVALRGSDFDGGGIGGEGIGGKVEFESCARQIARITVAPAIMVRPAMRIGGREELVSVRDLDLKVSPEILGSRDGD